MRPLPTHEIGSMAKPPWRVKPFRRIPLDDRDLGHAREWGARLGVEERDEVLGLLAKRDGFTAEEKERIVRFSSLYGTRLQERAGLDLVWDGEQHRVEMYEYPVRRMGGFAFRGHVRSFDDKYYRKASCVGKPTLEAPYHTDEYRTIAAFTRREVKIPVTGAYTLVDWSFDEHYQSGVTPGARDVGRTGREARRRFLNDVAVDIVHPNLRSLHEAGARFLQIDEPAATTKREEIPEFVEATRASIGDLAGKAFFTIHICFSNYDLLFPRLTELEGVLDEVHLEYANRDSREPGVSKAKRVGYGILDSLKNTGFTVGLGVLDVHTDFIEPPELVRDRILYACEVIGDPGRIFVAPDCGLRTRNWEVTFAKLSSMVAGRDLAAEKLGLSP
jgi:5-methyltetrahydropteroyltriglutamate--homocysteine methyltransferase